MADRVPDYEIKRRPRGLKVVFNCPVCSSVFTADALADAGNEHTCSCGRVLTIPGQQEADEYRRTEQEKRYQTAVLQVAAGAAKAKDAKRKKYRDFISPPQAAAAESAAGNVKVVGWILAALCFLGALFCIAGGFFEGLIITGFLLGFLGIIQGFAIGYAAEAAAAHLRNAAHQTRLLAHLLDYAHHADVADHAPVQSTHPPTTPG